MSNIAIITARGGSKRIPRKNIKEFCGKPILVYSIEAALESNLFSEVMVSTDDQEIADIAASYGAKVPFMRSLKNSDDHATTADVLLEVLSDYRRIGQIFQYVCCIYPTAPFVTSDKLRKSYSKILKEKADALVPVVKFSYPPQRCFVLREGKLAYKWPENMLKRSQDLEPLYHDAGQFYFLRADKLMENKMLVYENTIPFLLDEMEVQDIDNQEDWRIAEIKFDNMQGIV